MLAKRPLKVQTLANRPPFTQRLLSQRPFSERVSAWESGSGLAAGAASLGSDLGHNVIDVGAATGPGDLAAGIAGGGTAHG